MIQKLILDLILAYCIVFGFLVTFDVMVFMVKPAPKIQYFNKHATVLGLFCTAYVVYKFFIQ
jgi:hypothetical protein